MDDTNSQVDASQPLPVTDPVQSQPPQSQPVQPQPLQTEPGIPMSSWQTPTPVQNTSPWQTTPIPETPQVETVLQAPWQGVQAAVVSTVSAPYATPLPVASEPLTSPVVVSPSDLSSKKGVSPAIMAVVVMFLAAGTIGGTYFVSRGISTNAPVAPNAPASEPQAFEPTEAMPTDIVTTPVGGFDPNGTIDCTDVPDTAPYGNRCVATVVTETGEVVWAPGAIEELE